MEELIKIDPWDDCEIPRHGHKGNCVRIFMQNNIALKTVFKYREFSKIHQEYLFKEFSILSNLSHPNIIKVRGYREDNSIVQMKMDYFPYCLANVFDIISKSKRLNIYCKIEQAVNYLFDNSICHRDITTQNIMLNLDHEPFLIDFQSATILKQNRPFMESLDYSGKTMVESCCGDFISKNLLQLRQELDV